MFKRFISRNKSVFFIGVATLLIFVTIIVVSGIRRAGNKLYGPHLEKVEESSESTNIVVKNLAEDIIDDFVLEGTESSYSVLPEEQYSQTDSKYGTVKIEYSESGFSPANAKAMLNQKIKWVNTTHQDIFIKQDSGFFREFKNPILVPANGTMEFRMYRAGVWSYQEQLTGNPGNITTIRP